MKQIAPVIAAALAVLVLFATYAAHADGWKRERTTIGPHGGHWSKSSSGHCYNNHCSSRQKWTGPAGRSLSRSGAASCSNGHCSGSATWTGPRGHSVTRSRTYHRH